jgi:undecaprenyl-diphosphatase
LNLVDTAIVESVNRFAQDSWAFDRLVGVISINHLLKGGVFAVLIWWQWFRLSPRQVEDRERVLATILSSVVAMAIARVLAMTLPFRNRPMHEPALHFVLPHGAAPEMLDGWSSFPSDHATLFFALATGLLFVSRPVGVVALLYAVVFVAAPRVYMGLHYPTDLLAGALLGVVVVTVGNAWLLRTWLPHWLVGWCKRHPGYFYPGMFLFTYQIADNFEAARALLKAGWGALGGR